MTVNQYREAVASATSQNANAAQTPRGTPNLSIVKNTPVSSNPFTAMRRQSISIEEAVREAIQRTG